MKYDRSFLTSGFKSFTDKKLSKVKTDWLSQSNELVSHKKFIEIADNWFKSSKRNSIIGWDKFSCIDWTFGNNHFIESTAGRLKWHIQVLPWEYNTYKLMGIQQTQLDDLVPEVPLFITLPNYKHGGMRPEWEQVLEICKERNIDIHIDLAWYPTAKNFELDLNHDCIKSFAMSFSKYDMLWNRCGIRWCKQRTMDSITLQNFYYTNTNQNLMSAGAFFCNRIPMDYFWDNYEHLHHEVCDNLDLTPSNLFHIAFDGDTPVGIGSLLTELAR